MANRYTANIAPGSSQGYLVDLVGSNKRVLDVGCASGYLAETLTAFGNTVTGVEYDPAAAEQARAHTVKVVEVDLDLVDLAEALPGETFDVVVFGDVLEHLRDSVPPLRAARSMLNPGGYVVISVPNVGHGDVRMSLLLGRFPYRDVGLLDSTHLRFFTRDTLQTLLSDAGFVAADVQVTRRPLFDTELGVSRDEVDPVVVAQMEADPETLVYQFVLSAVPQDATTLEAATAFDAQRLRLLVEKQTGELAALRAEVERLADVDGRAHAAETELAALQATRTLRYRRALLARLGR